MVLVGRVRGKGGSESTADSIVPTLGMMDSDMRDESMTEPLQANQVDLAQSLLQSIKS